MKKVLYAILICIIIAGIVVVATIGLNVDLIYSKNVELDVSIEKEFNKSDIEAIAKEVFGGEDVIVQEIELYGDMVSIKVPDNLSEEDLKAKTEELNNKINEKYELENKVDDIVVTHNPKIKLSSMILPYTVTLSISMVIILVYVAIRYKKLGVLKTLVTYILWILASELILLSIIAITRYPVDRIVIPMGLLLLVAILTILGFINESKLAKLSLDDKNKQ